MNVYKYKNCLKLNIWNSNTPEIDGHAICIFNVVSKEFRLFKFGTWGGINYIKKLPIKEITEISEDTKNGIIENVDKRLRLLSDEHRPTGVYNIIDEMERELVSVFSGEIKGCWRYKKDGLLDLYIEDFFFIYDNYVGDIEEKEVELPDLHKAYYRYLNENLNPKIVRTFPEL